MLTVRVCTPEIWMTRGDRDQLDLQREDGPVCNTQTQHGDNDEHTLSSAYSFLFVLWQMQMLRLQQFDTSAAAVLHPQEKFN